MTIDKCDIDASITRLAGSVVPPGPPGVPVSTFSDFFDQTKGGLRIPSNRPLPPLEIPHDNAPVERLELDLETTPQHGAPEISRVCVGGCRDSRFLFWKSIPIYDPPRAKTYAMFPNSGSFGKIGRVTLMTKDLLPKNN